MRMIMTALSALALSGCGAIQISPRHASQAAAGAADAVAAPQDLLEMTAADEEAVNLAIKAVRVTSYAFRLAVIAGKITPGSDRALRMAAGLEAAAIAVNAAADARDAQTFRAALDTANGAVAAILEVLNGEPT